MQSSTVEPLLDTINHPLRRKVIKELDSDHEIDLGGEGRENRIELVHVHLPKLAEADCIEYDHSEDPLKVRRGSRWNDTRETLKKLYGPRTI